LKQLLELDAIFLRHPAQTFSLRGIMEIVLAVAVALRLQVEDVARDKGICLGHIVVLEHLPFAHIQQPLQTLVRIALLHPHIADIVAGIHLARKHTDHGLLLLFDMGRIAVYALLALFGKLLTALGRLLHAVVFGQVVLLDDLDEQLGIFRIGGIARLFEAMRPCMVVGDVMVEQFGIALAGAQKLRMVAIAVEHRGIDPEALALGIVIVVILLALPDPVAFDAEMVARHLGQCAVAISALQQALRQRDAGRNPALQHLLHRKAGIGIDVFGTCQPACGRLGILPGHLPYHHCKQHYDHQLTHSPKVNCAHRALVRASEGFTQVGVDGLMVAVTGHLLLPHRSVTSKIFQIVFNMFGANGSIDLLYNSPSNPKKHKVMAIPMQFGIPFTPAEVATIQTSLQSIITIFESKMNFNMSNEERKLISSVGNKREPYIMRSINNYAVQFPNLSGQAYPHSLAAIDLNNYELTNMLASPLARIEELRTEMHMVSGHFAYEFMRDQYDNAKRYRSNNVAGAQVVYDGLKDCFEGQGQKQNPT
jgi:hypothetical protein